MNTSSIYDKLNRGPAFLFLGQNYLAIESGEDPFLAEIRRKYADTVIEPENYQLLFAPSINQSDQSAESSLAWMQERCKRLVSPEWLNIVASFAWNGLYTSAIDVIWQNALKAPWRELEFIFTEERDPLDSRSRTRLHCTYLFGSVDQADPEYRPPLTRMQLNRRRQVAVALLRRLPRLLTPLGVLCIEGYLPQNDWLPLEDLLAVIDEMREGQVFLFHANEELSNDLDVQTLVNSGKLQLFEQSLASFLHQGEHIISLDTMPDDAGEGYRIRMAGRTVSIPISLWNQVSRSAIILEDGISVAPQAMSPDKQYIEYRNYLARSGERPIWLGYQQGFAFKRDYEELLYNRVINALQDKELATRPIILHGQSGVGKTIALGGLGYRIENEGKYPVLFIERKPLRPNYDELERFSSWAEDNDAEATLIIWDGMLDYDQYLDVLERLISRGRKIVLVGSSYRIANQLNRPNNSSSKKFIEAGSVLNEDETTRFESYLKRILPTVPSTSGLANKHDANFFVALYRILPTTRGQLRSGISLEAAYTEDRLTEISRKSIDSDADEIFTSPLAYAMAKAGLIGTDIGFSEKVEEIGGEHLNEIQQLIGFVMVPGRFGMRLPIELLMRTVGYNAPLDVVDILSQVDLFTWLIDAVGNVTIGPRHALEAELIVRSRLGGYKYEIEFIAQLIRNISSADTEIQFALDLIRYVNSADENQYTNPYSPHLIEIANSLTYVREQKGLINPRLMLQETNLLRETVKFSGDEMIDSTSTGLLERAEAVISSALKIVDQEGFNVELRSQLLVELASTLGARAKSLYSTDPPSAFQYFEHLRQYLFDARSASRANFYPIDVLFWTTQDLVRNDNVPTALQLDAKAELLNMFEMAELEETFSNLQRFQERKQQLGYLLNDSTLSEEAFAELDRQGATAGYVLKAAQIAGPIPHDRVPTQSELERMAISAAFLEENRRKIQSDGRSLQMLLRNWWLSKAGRKIFWNERQTVPFSSQDWNYCFELLSDILRCDEVYRGTIVQYLLGVTLFHTNAIENSQQVFREIETDMTVRGRRRIIRSYLASSPDGTARKYSGTVDWVDTRQNRGEIYVPEIRRRIPFIPSDFRRLDITKGSGVNDFHIAFNFRGFVADPAGYLSFLERQDKS